MSGKTYSPVDVACNVCQARLRGASVEAAGEWLLLHAHPQPSPWQEEAQAVIKRVERYENEHPAALLNGTPCFGEALAMMEAAYKDAEAGSITAVSS